VHKMYIPRKFKKREKPYKFLTLSFDDGVKQDERFIKMLDERGIKCTFNINSGLFGNVHNAPYEGGEVPHDEVEAKDVNRIYQDHEVAAHTLTHPLLSHLTEEEVIKEVGEDQKTLAELSGQEVFGLAYPFGRCYTEETIRIILENTPIRYARNIASHHGFEMPDKFMEWRPSCHWREESCIKLAKDFIDLDAKEDSLFYIWGHSYEFDMYNGWDEITELLDLIAGHDDIEYVTNGEIYKYITEE